MEGFKKVGTFGVDAGLCWIGDPCYVVSKDASHVWSTWDKFCDEHDSDKKVNVFPAGICVSSGYGDGEYPVYVKKQDGRVKEVLIKFF